MNIFPNNISNISEREDMKQKRTNYYSIGLNITLLIVALLIGSPASAAFLVSTVHSFLIKFAMVPNAKRFSANGYKRYYQERGELYIYRKQLIRIYWFFFILGIGSLIFLR